MLICAPGRLPYSAPYVSVTTENSRTASTPSNWPLTPPGVAIDFRSAGEFHSIEQVKILLWPAARSREHVSDHRIGRSDSPRALGCVIDDAGIQRKQLVVAATRSAEQVLHLPLADQPGDILVGYGDDIGAFRYGDALLKLV